MREQEPKINQQPTKEVLEAYMKGQFSGNPVTVIFNTQTGGFEKLSERPVQKGNK